MRPREGAGRSSPRRRPFVLATPGRLRLVCAASLLLGASRPASAAKKWQQVSQDDGITVMNRTEPGRDFPTFRAVGKVKANLYQVMAVLSDTPRLWEWVDSCTSAKVLKVISSRERILYQRTHAPWPVSDRDTVYQAKVTDDPKAQTIKIRFWATETRLKGRVSGVVRMTKLRGHFHLQGLGEELTRIEYQIDADPEGWLPKWIAKLVTRKMPLNTIRNLRKQVVKTRGWYHKRIARWKAGK